MCLAAGAAHADWNSGADLTGVWWAKTVSDRLVPVGGGPIPFTAAGKAAYAKRMGDLKSGAYVDRSIDICLPRGVPRAWLTAWPIQIVQTPNGVSVLYEENRQVHLLRNLPKHFDSELWDPSYMGESIAHWDGDTLVADTVNFNDDTMLDATGLPHSDKLKVTEKLHLLDGGRRLQVETTIDDPTMYSAPWTARFVYDRRDDVVVKTDWVCGEKHRDVSSVKVVKAGK